MHYWNGTEQRKKGRGAVAYIDNINKWTRTFLEENITVAEGRTACRKLSCAAGAGNVRTDDAD